MVDRIVQLTDKSGNNIFPVAGQMAQGSIITNMLTDNAITTAKVADGGITDSKITYTKTTGTNSSYLYLGDILIQWGQISGVTNSNKTFTMPKAFANTNYTLTLTSQYNEAGASFWWANIISKTTNSFVARGGYHAVDGSGGGGNTNNILNWIAIGVKA